VRRNSPPSDVAIRSLRLREMRSRLRADEKLNVNFDNDFTPCGCVTHDFSTACTSVASAGVFHRCMACGAQWLADPITHEPLDIVRAIRA
jgi:hypothetical protein